MKAKLSFLATGILLAAVTLAYSQPIITNQPQSQAVAPGKSVTFSVGASGLGPLAYQWQRNVGAGFSDLALRTDASLVLTNAQPWDAADYRVIVTNFSGTRTSAVASLHVMSPGVLTNRAVLDTFDDNKLTGWTPYGAGTLIESNQQYTVRGYWPGQRTLSTYDTFCVGALSTSSRTVGQGQTVEWRVDLVRMDENATNAVKFLVGTTSGGYGLFKWRDFILLDKYTGGVACLYTCDRTSIPNTNVVLAFALTRLGPNVILTARVLDKDDPDVVLYERSYVDTPGSDPTLSTADAEQLSGMRLAFSPDPSEAPYTNVLTAIGLFQYTDGTRPSATVTYDNLEVWTYRVPVAHYVDVNSTNPTPPYANWATAARVIQDAVDAAAAGDEIIVTNGLYATGGRAVGTNLLVNRVAVDKPLTLRSVNGPQFTIIQGYQVPGTTNGDGAVRCVYLANGASLSGFTLTNGATRARDTNGFSLSLSESSGGGVWCESTNGVVVDCVLTGNSAVESAGGAYSGTLINCTLRENTAYRGGGAADGILNNCTCTSNSVAAGGGGALNAKLTSCILTGNWSAGTGGGVAECLLNNSVLSNNSSGFGGGADWSTLRNCTLTGNSAGVAGGGVSGDLGIDGCTLYNCIVYSNTAAVGANFSSLSFLNYCCTTPLPEDGVGNITNAPLFVDYAGGNLGLQSNSPCINAGNNEYAPGPTNLDGNPRIVSGTVDIGAYEFQGSGSVISYAWLQQFGLPTDGSADAADPDADGHTTWQEWRCQTDPTNALSALRLLSATPGGNDVTVRWQSVVGVTYFLERSTNLASSPCFLPLASGIVGQPGTTSFTDTNAASLAPLFYRAGVEP